MSWQVASAGLLALALAGGFGWFEHSRPPARVVALVATLAALAVVGRLAFAAVPNVKPTTDIVLFAGYALGALPGFAVGATSALVSNTFLSQGPWTPWQMVGWGVIGLVGALLARALRGREPNRVVLALLCGLAGFLFGAWMDLYQLTLAARQDLETYVALSISSFPYNLAHAIGNVVFCLLIGPVFIRALRRYRQRLEVSWPVPAAAAGALLLALLVAAPASAATPSERAARYLERAQNPDGGFGNAPGEESNPLYSGWAALGLAAAGENPGDQRARGGRSLVRYLRADGSSFQDIGELERTALVLGAAGLPARDFAGRDLIAAIQARRRGNGSYAGFVSYTSFGVLALRAAGESAGAETVSWLARAQNPDGGFGLTPGTTSDSDMTGSTLQALAVTGRSGGPVAHRAVSWLRANQNGNGGFGQSKGRVSNAQSTSYAVQGLVAVRAAPAAVARALRFLRGLQRRDGSIAYSRTSAQTPVWVTAQALMALERKPLPLAAVPRAPRPSGAASATAPDEPEKAAGTAAPAVKEEERGKPSRSKRGRAAPAPAPGAPAPVPAPEPEAGQSAGAEPERSLALERTRDEDDGGSALSSSLPAGAVVASLLLLWLFRRRLPLRGRRSPSP
jgi:energy-coupling factor transport system substrate-specific component